MNYSVSYFDPAEVEENRKRDKIGAPKLQKFLAGKKSLRRRDLAILETINRS